MKKIVFLIGIVLCFQQLNAQIYLKPIITPISSIGACDASIICIPYGGTPPYSFLWYDYGTWQPCSAFKVNNLCPDKHLGVSIRDANCFLLEAVIRIDENPANQMQLDTIIINYPTTGNNDGSIQVQMNSIPAGYYINWNIAGSSSTITGLGPGNYNFHVWDTNAELAFEITIPLFSGTVTPCSPFRTEVTPRHFSSFHARMPDCTQVGPPPPPEDPPGSDEDPDLEIGSYCDGSFTATIVQPVAGTFDIKANYHMDGGAAPVFFNDGALTSDSSMCRGPYSLYYLFIESSSSYTNFSNYNTFFIQDSLDTSSLWNVPDSIPPNTDTVVMDALNRPIIEYYLAVDTVYIDMVEVIGAGQFQITTAIVQPPDTFYLHHIEFLDSSMNYILDVTVFEGDSLFCLAPNSQRHIIYFEWPQEPEPPCDSIQICHVPSGNPGAAVSIWIPCGDTSDHIGNHVSDYYGPCTNHMMQPSSINPSGTAAKYLRIFPNPFEERLDIQSSYGISHVEIYSFDGKLITSHVVNSTRTTIDTKTLGPSTYFIKVYYADATVEMRKLVKIK